MAAETRIPAYVFLGFDLRHHTRRPVPVYDINWADISGTLHDFSWRQCLDYAFTIRSERSTTSISDGTPDDFRVQEREREEGKKGEADEEPSPVKRARVEAEAAARALAEAAGVPPAPADAATQNERAAVWALTPQTLAPVMSIVMGRDSLAVCRPWFTHLVSLYPRADRLVLQGPAGVERLATALQIALDTCPKFGAFYRDYGNALAMLPGERLAQLRFAGVLETNTCMFLTSCHETHYTSDYADKNRRDSFNYVKEDRRYRDLACSLDLRNAAVVVHCEHSLLDAPLGCRLLVRRLAAAGARRFELRSLYMIAKLFAAPLSVQAFPDPLPAELEFDVELSDNAYAGVALSALFRRVARLRLGQVYFEHAPEDLSRLLVDLGVRELRLDMGSVHGPGARLSKMFAAYSEMVTHPETWRCLKRLTLCELKSTRRRDPYADEHDMDEAWNRAVAETRTALEKGTEELRRIARARIPIDVLVVRKSKDDGHEIEDLALAVLDPAVVKHVRW